VAEFYSVETIKTGSSKKKPPGDGDTMVFERVERLEGDRAEPPAQRRTRTSFFPKIKIWKA
jgi:hypothetical protein